MANTKMSIKQWEEYQRAIKLKDMDRAQSIMDMGYQPEFDITLLDAKEAEIIEETEQADELDEILNDVASGLENKEICEKYGISPQKLGSIKKGAK